MGEVHIKDEGQRLGLGSFKALGGAYAVLRPVLEAASRIAGRTVDVSELGSPEVARVAAGITVACATDGNHGRSVAQGAALTDARAKIFLHAGVSDVRAACKAVVRRGSVPTCLDVALPRPPAWSQAMSAFRR